MQLLNNKNKLLDGLAKGAALITPNNRLSAKLLEDYFTQQGSTTRSKPYCTPYGQMLHQVFGQLQFKTPDKPYPILLNTAQCQHLWRKIITSTPDIAFSEGLLKAVMEAWISCQQWCIRLNHPSFNHTAQTAQFKEWWQRFTLQIQALNAITEHDLVPYLLDATPKLKHTLFPKTIIWVSFDEFNPQQVLLQEALEKEGFEQYHYDLQEEANPPRLLAAKDSKEEYQQLMAWLRLRIQEGDECIGLVVLNLQKEARRLHRLLLKHFDPSLYNISLGQTLGEFPLVSHALTWLKLDKEQLRTHEASLFLQSPYLAFAEREFLGRAHFLQESPLLQQQSIPWEVFCKELTSFAPELSKRLNQLKPFPAEAFINEWVALFQERLNNLGFPNAALDSLHYQCFNRFSAIFDEFRQLSLITPKLNKGEALKAFETLLNNTIFQAKKTKAPIQIFGLLEASGHEFDSLWLMGLTDEQLPNKTNLSPFISPELQRQLNMPHSNSARELAFAKRRLERFQRSALQSVFSYPRIENEHPNLPCSLVTDFPCYTPLVLHEIPSPLRTIAMEESYHLPLLDNENREASTALLANQAKCPFKAFASHRLYAKASLPSIDGLDERLRGQIIHKVMELLWRDLKSQEALCHLNESQLDQYVDVAIETSLGALNKTQGNISKIIKEVEFKRIKNIVLSSLEWEKQRPPFKIAALEEAYSIKLLDLNFKVRVDRLDEVNHNKWLIDYKSTLSQTKPWNEDRPQEPQLLLYALLDPCINTLLFIQLKTAQLCFSGLSEENHEIKGIKPLNNEEHWSDYTKHWQEELNRLAQEFQEGYCPPNPMSQSVCKGCDFQNLCRFQQV